MSRNCSDLKPLIEKIKDTQIERTFEGLIASCNLQRARSFTMALARWQSCKKGMWGRVIQMSPSCCAAIVSAAEFVSAPGSRTLGFIVMSVLYSAPYTAGAAKCEFSIYEKTPGGGYPPPPSPVRVKGKSCIFRHVLMSDRLWCQSCYSMFIIRVRRC